MRVYLASPLGFGSLAATALPGLRAALRARGHEVFDPWERPAEDPPEREAAVAAMRRIGRRNAEAIAAADTVVAVLEGMEPDSGTVAEVGYGAGLGRRVYGLRTDARDAGDFPGLALNLQVLYFIETSGGRVVRTVEALIAALDETAAP